MTSNGSALDTYVDDNFQQAENNGEQTARSNFNEQNGHGINIESSRSPQTDFLKYNDNNQENNNNLKPNLPQSQSNLGNISNRSENRGSYGYRDHNSSDPQLAAKNLTLEYGKTIRLLRNGDEFYRGHKFVINSRKYRYFDVFMDDISNDLNANFGAIRKIHTPVHGHRVKNLDELEDGKTYVAAGNSRFIKINYTDVLEGKRPQPNNRLPSLNRPDYSSFVVPQYDTPQNALIYVYRNGDKQSSAVKILLYKSTMNSYDAVLDQISSRVKLPNGAVFRLFSIEGALLQGSSDIISGNSYVAAHKERFKKINYATAAESVSPRINRKTRLRHTRKENTNPNSLPNNLPPVRLQRTRVNVNVDKDDNGLYKARSNNSSVKNADTIEDAPNMYVDMPVDYKKTEQVDDEFMNDQKAARNITQKPPINPISQNSISKPNSKPPPSSQTQNRDITPPSKKIRDPSPSPIQTQRTPELISIQNKEASPDIFPQPDTGREGSSEKKLNVDYENKNDSPINKNRGYATTENQFNQTPDLITYRNEIETARSPSPRDPTPIREPTPRDPTQIKEPTPRDPTPIIEPTPRDPTPPQKRPPSIIRDPTLVREDTPEIDDIPSRKIPSPNPNARNTTPQGEPPRDPQTYDSSPHYKSDSIDKDSLPVESGQSLKSESSGDDLIKPSEILKSNRSIENVNSVNDDESKQQE